MVKVLSVQFKCKSRMSDEPFSTCARPNKKRFQFIFFFLSFRFESFDSGICLRFSLFVLNTNVERTHFEQTDTHQLPEHNKATRLNGLSCNWKCEQKTYNRFGLLFCDANETPFVIALLLQCTHQCDDGKSVVDCRTRNNNSSLFCFHFTDGTKKNILHNVSIGRLSFGRRSTINDWNNDSIDYFDCAYDYGCTELCKFSWWYFCSFIHSRVSLHQMFAFIDRREFLLSDLFNFQISFIFLRRIDTNIDNGHRPNLTFGRICMRQTNDKFPNTIATGN